MKNKQILLLIFVISLIVLGALFVFNNRAGLKQEAANIQYEGTIQVTAPASVIDQETGEVDQDAFEESQKVSDDNSLDTLETELNSTIILEEDFSDL